jgi:hypothetical protein
MTRRYARCLTSNSFRTVPTAGFLYALTQIYAFDGSNWKEDDAWTAQLDKDWDLGAVRDAAYQALAQVCSDVMV